MNPIQETIDAIEEALSQFGNLSINDSSRKKTSMDEATLQTILNVAIRQATEQTRTEFQDMIAELNRKITALQAPSVVEEYKEIEIVQGVLCDEPLDIVKSVPEFKGEASKYVSWRQAAVTAHRLFEPYKGSSKYYQAVAILRNKIVESANSVLSTYNTVLNFYAILDRLDFAYSDKTSIYTLEQILSTLRQGQRPIIIFYNDVESKLTSIINKVIMTYEGDNALIKSLTQKYRMDALRVFISGLRKPLCDTLFSCKPTDLPTALALAQELETNQNRYHFATIYNNGLGKPHQSYFTQMSPRPIDFGTSNSNNQTSGNSFRQAIGNSPFNSQIRQPSNQSAQFYPQFRTHSRANLQPANTQSFGMQSNSQTLDTDVSMRTVNSNNSRGTRGLVGNANSGRQNFRNMQGINHLNHEDRQMYPREETPITTNDYAVQEDQIVENLSFEDEINFLGEGQFSHTLNE